MRKTFCLLSIILMIIVSSCSTAPINLIVYKYPNGKYGYVDENGKKIIEGKFDYAASFCEDKAVVAMGDMFGYIDQKGELVIPLEYLRANDFCDGLAKVNKKGLIGYIDKNGKEVIPCLYDNITEDEEQPNKLYGIQSGKHGIIDKTGKTILPFEYDEINVCEHPDRIMIIKSGLKGFANKSGEILLNPDYTEIENFVNSYYLVCKESGWGCIDSLYNEVIPCGFGRITYIKYKDDEFLVKVLQNGLYGLFNNKGTALTPVKYSSIGDFNTKGIVPVELDGKQGRVNEDGKEILAPIYNRILQEDDNLYFLSKNYKEGIADSTGHVFIECKYKSIKNIDKNYFVVYKDNDDMIPTCGMFDRRGELVYDFIYREIISDEYFIYPHLREKDLIGVANKATAQFIIPCKFSSIGNFVLDGGKYARTIIAHPEHIDCYKAEGLIDTSGCEILPCNYYYVNSVNNDVASVRDCGSAESYNLKLKSDN